MKNNEYSFQSPNSLTSVVEACDRIMKSVVLRGQFENVFSISKH